MALIAGATASKLDYMPPLQVWSSAKVPQRTVALQLWPTIGLQNLSPYDRRERESNGVHMQPLTFSHALEEKLSDAKTLYYNIGPTRLHSAP
jgi:hypothetical protein